MQNIGVFSEKPEKGPAILLVDDEPSVLKAVTRMLYSLGYRNILQAESVEKAIDIWQSNSEQIEVLISDFVMPSRTGDLMASDMLKEKPNLKILLISGNDPGSLECMIPINAGFNYLQKPFTVSEMREIL